MNRIKFTVEFLFRASPNILYKFFTTPDLLIRWFCDEADITGKTYTFFWEGTEEVAFLKDSDEGNMLRLHWEEADDDDEYLEFSLSKSPVTGETILLITDFCDDDEIEDQKQLWETQIAALRSATGG